MKLIIKVGDAMVEIEGAGLKATKVASAGVPVEIIQSKSREEETDELCERVTIGLRNALTEARRQGKI